MTFAENPMRFDSDAKFDAHCSLMTSARMKIERGEYDAALKELNAALAEGESPHARWNRALTLLALGRYGDGWKDFKSRLWITPHLLTTDWGKQLRTDLPQWKGEPLPGKRLVVIHEAGFGDTIMLLRYVPKLQAMGINVALVVPPELARLANQLAPLVAAVNEFDVQCFTFDLMHILNQNTPDDVPHAPYLKPDAALVEQWQLVLKDETRRKVGIAWSTMRGGVQRNAGLDPFLAHFDARDYALFSIQGHDMGGARARGVTACQFHDFADVAALASCMDQIVSIDTGALHVAGAIGHPDVSAVLPHVACWRWQFPDVWYPQMKLYRQAAFDDWASAFAQLKDAAQAAA